MILDLSPADITILVGALTGVCGTTAAVIQHLYSSRETERNARLSDAEKYTSAMLEVQEKLRAEDAKEIADLRARVDHYSSPEFRLPPRRRSKP